MIRYLYSTTYKFKKIIKAREISICFIAFSPIDCTKIKENNAIMREQKPFIPLLFFFKSFICLKTEIFSRMKIEDTITNDLNYKLNYKLIPKS